MVTFLHLGLWQHAFDYVLLCLKKRWINPHNLQVLIPILFHIYRPMHIMYYLLTKEELQMAFGGVDGVACGTGPGFGAGIAVVVVIILLLIALGIVF